MKCVKYSISREDEKWRQTDVATETFMGRPADKGNGVFVNGNFRTKLGSVLLAVLE